MSRKDSQTKYYVGIIPLKEYCLNNDISYVMICKRIKKLAKNTDYSQDEIVNKALTMKSRRNKYVVGDNLLVDYCKNKGISYQTIVSRIKKLQDEDPNLTPEEASNLAIIEEIYRCKYKMGDISFSQYCANNGINYRSMKNIIKKVKETHPSYSYEQIVEEALKHEIIPRNKYYIDDKTLSQYCYDNNIKRYLITNRIPSLRKKYPEYTDDEILNLALDLFNKYKRIREINEIFANTNSLDENNYKLICEKLDIASKCVEKLVNFNFTYEQSVKFLYFFPSLAKLNEELMFKILNRIKNINISNYNNNFFMLYRLYKCEIANTKEAMLNYYRPIIKRYVNSFIKSHSSINYDEYKCEELFEEGCLKLLEIIDKSYNSNKQQLISYIKSSIQGALKYYAKNVAKWYINNISLDVTSKDDLELYNFIDYDRINGNLSFEEKVEEDFVDLPFSEKLLDAINYLDKQSILFIKLRYVLQYNYYDIANSLNMNIDEVKELEGKIIKSLKENSRIITLVKK